MRRELVAVSGMLVAGFGLMACQPAGLDATNKKLDDVLTKLDALDKKVTAGAGRPQPMQPPPGPDPAAVYAVDITGAAYVGPEHAKVTIVEAFEFA